MTRHQASVAISPLGPVEKATLAEQVRLSEEVRDAFYNSPFATDPDVWLAAIFGGFIEARCGDGGPSFTVPFMIEGTSVILGRRRVGTGWPA